MPHDPIPGSEDQDTELFRQLDQHVLDNHPNPDRVGCFAPDELRELVSHPERFDLKDTKYLHLFRCAECTHDIISLRDRYEREAANQNAAQTTSTSTNRKDTAPSEPKSRINLFAFVATAFGSLCLGGLLVWLSMRPRTTGVGAERVSSSQTAEVVDLTTFYATHGVSTAAGIVMMREASTFIIELPPLSPSGKYHVAVVGTGPEEKVSSDGVTRSVSGQLELPVTLSLTALQPGPYRLAIRSDADSAPDYYAASIR